MILYRLWDGQVSKDFINMAKSKQGKSGGQRKWGRDAAKCQRYKLAMTREKNKLKRVLQSSGKKEARTYAKNNGVLAYFEKLKE